MIEQNMAEFELLEKEVDSLASDIWGMNLNELLEVQNSQRELS